MSLTETPRSNRLHIGLFGKRNSGKSSLINAITNQEIALVSDVPGTTTDPVYKSMEIQGIGPCLFIDTAGFGELGQMRVEKTKKVIEKTDIALVLFNADYINGNNDNVSYNIEDEARWIDLIIQSKTPVIAVVNKADITNNADIDAVCSMIKGKTGIPPIIVSAKEKTGIEKIREEIIRSLPEDFEMESITGNLVNESDLVLLVMPQDIQAPKGRLILPQVQTTRDLLDKKCVVLCVTTDKLEQALKYLSEPPKLIITDSQVFRAVYDKKPKESKLTSFSVLFANYKGDLKYFVESAYIIEKLTEDSRVLIAEACTHAPLEEDIGRVKIPQMLRKRISEKLNIDMVSGTDFPDDLSPYDLIIHCGGCMFNRKYVLSRVKKARSQGIPMTNYGVTLAYLSNILDKIDL